MVELISTFKICLGLVLLTGLITGYLYTLFSTKEQYEPILSELEDKIVYNREQTALQGENYLAMRETRSKELKEAEKISQAIETQKETIAAHQKHLQKATKVNNTLKERYTSIATIIDTLKKKKAEIINEISKDSIQSLSEKDTQLKEQLRKLENELEVKKDTLFDIQIRHERIEAQKNTLEEEQKNLLNSITLLQQELEKIETKQATYEEKMRQKIASLEKEANIWLEKIKAYKEALLRLKER